MGAAVADVMTTTVPEPEEELSFDASVALNTGVNSITETKVPEPPEVPRRAFLRGVGDGVMGQALLEDDGGLGMAYLMPKSIQAKGD
jgi:hypothetical protein